MAYCADFSRCAEAILEHFLGPLETVRESLRGVPVLVMLLQENECCQFLRASPFLSVQTLSPGWLPGDRVRTLLLNSVNSDPCVPDTVKLD